MDITAWIPIKSIIDEAIIVTDKPTITDVTINLSENKMIVTILFYKYYSNNKTLHRSFQALGRFSKVKPNFSLK